MQQEHAYADEIVAFGISTKEITRNVKAIIRKRAICSHSAVLRTASGGKWKPKSLLPLIGQKSAYNDEGSLRDHTGGVSVKLR